VETPSEKRASLHALAPRRQARRRSRGL